MAGLLNMACVMALNTVAKGHERLNGTIDLNISFTRPAIGSLTAEARVVQKGRKIGFVCCDIRDEQGRIVATGRIVHAIGLRNSRGKVVNDAEYLWPDLDLLRHHYLETKRGDHPAWVMSPAATRCRRGHIEFEHEISEGRANQAGGSMLCGMVDIACVAAVSTVVRKGEVRAGTIELNLSFLRPAVGVGNKIIIAASIVRKGSSVANVNCTITDHKGREVVCGRISYAIRPDVPEEPRSWKEAKEAAGSRGKPSKL
jgi:acyl-coenzyme A thioesterase PaaI-like protein